MAYFSRHIGILLQTQWPTLTSGHFYIILSKIHLIKFSTLLLPGMGSTVTISWFTALTLEDTVWESWLMALMLFLLALLLLLFKLLFTLATRLNTRRVKVIKLKELKP